MHNLTRLTIPVILTVALLLSGCVSPPSTDGTPDATLSNHIDLKREALSANEQRCREIYLQLAAEGDYWAQSLLAEYYHTCPNCGASTGAHK